MLSTYTCMCVRLYINFDINELKPFNETESERAWRVQSRAGGIEGKGAGLPGGGEEFSCQSFQIR